MDQRTSPDKIDFPQEWDAHLLDGFEPMPIDKVPPRNQAELGFSDMDYVQFEQFCLWLLQKENNVVGCRRLGNNGREQGGIDLFAYDKLITNELIVYECKCWGDLSAGKLTFAIKRFLTADFAHQAKRFVLILAQPFIGSAYDAWMSAKAELESRGITAECWTGEKLTYMVQPYPDIVSKFFPGAMTDQYCNEWMRRTHFIELLNKAASDPRAYIADYARRILGDISTEEITGEEVRTHGEQSWSYHGPLLGIYCVLPSEKLYPGSATITIKRPNLDGVTIVLNQKWLLENMLGNAGEPLNSACRPFYVWRSNVGEDLHLIDLGNCRMTMHGSDLVRMIPIIDELSTVYLNALLDLNRKWRADRFPFVQWGGVRVALGLISKPLWNVILKFSQERDYEAGESNWHIFDRKISRLIPYSRKLRPDSIRRPHGMFDAELLFPFDSDRLTLMWTPPSTAFRSRVSDEDWWNCERAYHWFQEELLPEVERWWLRAQMAQVKWVSRLFSASHHRSEYELIWFENANIRDVRMRALLDDRYFERCGMQETLETLQGFYNGAGKCGRAYFTIEQMADLYRAAAMLVEGGRGYLGYIISKLSLDDECNDHQDAVRNIRQKLDEGRICATNDVAECVMRAMLEALNDDEKWVPYSTRTTVYNALMPFMRFYDQQQLIDQHNKYL